MAQSVCMQVCVCVREIRACLVTQALQYKIARILIWNFPVPHRARTHKTNMAEDSENKSAKIPGGSDWLRTDNTPDLSTTSLAKLNGVL